MVRKEGQVFPEHQVLLDSQDLEDNQDSMEVLDHQDLRDFQDSLAKLGPKETLEVKGMRGPKVPEVFQVQLEIQERGVPWA